MSACFDRVADFEMGVVPFKKSNLELFQAILVLKTFLHSD
jgi:hypothetical protein